MSDLYGEAPVETPKTNTLALTSLITGIASLVLLILGSCIATVFFPFAACSCVGLLLGITALVTGLVSNRRIKEDPENQTGGGMATAGIIMGAIATALGVLAAIAGLVIFILALLGPAVGNVFSNILIEI